MLDNTLKIFIKKEFSLQEATGRLQELGYSRVDEVGLEGDFSLRGDTLEVFPVNFNFPIRIEWSFDVVDKIYTFDKILHKKILDYDFLIIIPHHKKHKKYSSEDIPLEAVLRVKPGDYVVHTRHGIGRFIGSKKLNLRGKEEYFFELHYDRGDKLYLPPDEAHLIQKYVNFGAKGPKLSRLGSKEWLRIKEKVEKGIKRYALELLRMDAQRKIIGGFKYSPDNQWHKMFADRFPYEATPDQVKAIDDVRRDMENGLCMDRIVCGDVGYGKTEVAMRAAFKAVMDSKQVAFLVPTTILAYQHYINLVKRLEDFP